MLIVTRRFREDLKIGDVKVVALRANGNKLSGLEIVAVNGQILHRNLRELTPALRLALCTSSAAAMALSYEAAEREEEIATLLDCSCCFPLFSCRSWKGRSAPWQDRSLTHGSLLRCRCRGIRGRTRIPRKKRNVSRDFIAAHAEI